MGREVHFPGRVAAGADRALEPPFRVEDLDVVGVGIRHVEALGGGVVGHPGRPGQDALADRALRVAPGIQPGHQAEFRVRHEHGSRRAGGHADRGLELLQPVRAIPDQQLAGGLIEDEDRAAADVGDEDAAPLVHRPGLRALQHHRNRLARQDAGDHLPQAGQPGLLPVAPEIAFAGQLAGVQVARDVRLCRKQHALAFRGILHAEVQPGGLGCRTAAEQRCGETGRGQSGAASRGRATSAPGRSWNGSHRFRSAGRACRSGRDRSGRFPRPRRRCGTCRRISRR